MIRNLTLERGGGGRERRFFDGLMIGAEVGDLVIPHERLHALRSPY